MNERLGVCPEAEFHRAQKFYESLGRIFNISVVPTSVAELRDFRVAVVREDAVQGAGRGRDRFSALTDVLDPIDGHAIFLLPQPVDTVHHLDENPLACERDALLSNVLQGRLLPCNGAAACSRLEPAEGERVLARAGQADCWSTRSVAGSRVDRTICLPDPATPEGSFFQALYDGHLLPLLPLLEFLRGAFNPKHGKTAEIRATFIVDDPNLHFRSYGHLEYREVVRHARSHGYHVTFGTIPLDLWYASGSAARLFRNAGDVVSLAMHGNNHLHEELKHLAGDEHILRNGAQALRRVDAFERRYSVPIARVMVPPHGASSEALLRIFQRLDYDAFAISLPFPWLFGQTIPRDLNPERPETRWNPADIVTGGMPIIHRSGEPREFMWLAYVGAPIMKYYHHGDFAGGLDLFAEDARFIGQFGETRWMSLREIAQSNYRLFSKGSEQTVSLFSRRVCIPRSALGSSLQVLFSPVQGIAGEETIVINGSEVGALAGGALRVNLDQYSSLPETVEICVRRRDRLDAGTVPPPATNYYPYIRRALTEGRDRAQRFLGR